MAVIPTVASSQTADFSSGGPFTSMTVTKPTGLAVGELLICHVALFNGNTVTSTPSSGFTLITNQASAGGTGACIAYTYYKIATSGDVAASTFTFGNSSSQGLISMLRITGNRAVNVIGAFNSNNAGNTTTLTTTGLTPADQNSLLLMFASGNVGAGPTTVSGYTIATSSPSWTEIYDTSGTGGVFLFAAAYGMRPAVTATGTSTEILSGSNANTKSIATFVAITSAQFMTSSDTVTVTDSMNLRRMVHIIISETVAVTDTIALVTKKLWNALTKSTPESDWTAEDKS